MSTEFKEPWAAVGEYARNLEQELARELTAGHPLWGARAQAIAQRRDSDDVLFVVEHESGERAFAVVHLTWSGRPSSDSGWPSTACYRSLEEWIQERMLQDQERYRDE